MFSRVGFDCSPLHDLFDEMLLLKAVLPVLFSLSVWVFDIFETPPSMSSIVTGGEWHVQLTSFRKEAKKGSAQAAVLLKASILSVSSTTYEFWDPRTHLVVSLKDQTPSVNAHI